MLFLCPKGITIVAEGEEPSATMVEPFGLSKASTLRLIHISSGLGASQAHAGSVIAFPQTFAKIAKVETPGLFVHYSRSLDQLCELATEQFRHPLPDPLEPEWVIVQSVGISRWLSLQIAERLGVCANIDFLLPNRAVSQLCGLLFPGERRPPAIRETLQWKINSVLPELLEHAEFGPVRSYLQSGTSREMRLFQLSESIAGVFDQYPVYRPELVLQWEKGGGEGWQPVLWRASAAEYFHESRMLSVLSEAVRKAPDLPSRVIAFGISSLPPIHLHFLSALSVRTRVELMINRPVSGAWSDQNTARESRRARERARAQGKDPDSLYLDIGNQLVRAWGKTGRDFAVAIDNSDLTDDTECEFPVAGETILAQIQRQIYDQEEIPAPFHRVFLAESDPSLQVHGCHSELRELEVLHDFLIDQFARNPDLKPSEVVVMAPDISRYGKLAPVVFSPRGKEWGNYLPYSIADRTPAESIDLVAVFLTLWENAEGRFEVSEILSIIDSRPVRTRFHLTTDSMEQIRDWLESTRVRWAMDPRHREKFNLPSVPGNTWEDGIDRLLMGFAMAMEDRELCLGLLPYDPVEGSDAEVLSKFLSAFEDLKSAAALLSGERSLVEWQTSIEQVAELLFDPGEESQVGLRALRAAARALAEEAKAAGYSSKIPADVARRAFLSRLSAGTGSAGFLSGGITFCELRPLRAVPFRLVCLLGMNDTAFPRRDRRPRFDLMQINPKLGDRSIREDDRYCFLETLMAARDVFFVSYLSHSLKDNADLQPSILINELLDYVATHFDGIAAKRESIVTHHRLHPFNPIYFSGNSRYFSYSKLNCEAASVLTAGVLERPVIPRLKLIEPEGDAWTNLTLDRFVRFFQNPCRAIVWDRMGIKLGGEEEPALGTEPFVTDRLEKYHLAELLLEEWDIPESNLLPYAAAAGLLPLGPPGLSMLDKIAADVQKARQFVAPIKASSQLKIEEFHDVIHGLSISGKTRLYDNRQILLRPGKLRNWDRLASWIRHLIVNVTSKKPVETWLVALDKTVNFRPVSEKDCYTYLGVLTAHYRSGLCKPLEFIPELSIPFAMLVGKNERRSADYWDIQFEKTIAAEDEVRLCFSSEVLSDAAFRQIAVAICDPFLEWERITDTGAANAS